MPLHNNVFAPYSTTAWCDALPESLFCQLMGSVKIALHLHLDDDLHVNEINIQDGDAFEKAAHSVLLK